MTTTAYISNYAKHYVLYFQQETEELIPPEQFMHANGFDALCNTTKTFLAQFNINHREYTPHQSYIDNVIRNEDGTRTIVWMVPEKNQEHLPSHNMKFAAFYLTVPNEQRFDYFDFFVENDAVILDICFDEMNTLGIILLVEETTMQAVEISHLQYTLQPSFFID